MDLLESIRNTDSNSDEFSTLSNNIVRTMNQYDTVLYCSGRSSACSTVQCRLYCAVTALEDFDVESFTIVDIVFDRSYRKDR